ncbi:hypothetical protein OG511_05625 [Streptomyces sp. NBC_01453]|uniref:hypothetical protein n=1 Tax=Streptomyces sp. NBC_01453 TaxID=2903873 RepID=UPI002E2B8D1F|nr:hypothetical protein [Streptomyces sp. NBC_01453]
MRRHWGQTVPGSRPSAAPGGAAAHTMRAGVRSHVISSARSRTESTAESAMAK